MVTNTGNFVHSTLDDQALPKLKVASIAGLPISRLTRTQLTDWLGLALYASTPSTLMFADARSVDLCTREPQVMRFMKQVSVLLPRGRGLNLSINLLNSTSASDEDQDRYYDDIFLELEHRQASVCLLIESTEKAQTLVNSLKTRYPNLVLDALVVTQDQLSKNLSGLASQINTKGSQAVISALPSPFQEKLLFALNTRLHAPLCIALGTTLPAALEALDQKAGQSLLRKLARKRFSIALQPFNALRFMFTLAGLNKPRGRTESMGQYNQAILGHKGRIRLLRTTTWLRSLLWQLRCKTQLSLKRLIDLLGAGTGLLLLSPLLLSVMAVIKLSSPGPIFYSQIRVGFRGKTFRMWKFRSMYVDADARKAALEAQNEMEGGVIFKMKNDPRITPIGRIIRRLSIDELPQLFNVIRGDMSLVGPRPALEKEVAQYPVLARARLEAIPGLTGLWQISGRSDLPFDKQVLLDTTYVHTQSAANDIKLIAKTIPAVISGKGAY